MSNSFISGQPAPWLNVASATAAGEKFVVQYTNDSWSLALETIHQWREDEELPAFKPCVARCMTSQVLTDMGRKNVCDEHAIAPGIMMSERPIMHLGVSAVELQLIDVFDRVTICAFVGGSKTSEIIDSLLESAAVSEHGRRLLDAARPPLIRYLTPLDTDELVLTFASARRDPDIGPADVFVLLVDEPRLPEAVKMLSRYGAASSSNRVLSATEYRYLREHVIAKSQQD